jgi:hypothetical protein
VYYSQHPLENRPLCSVCCETMPHHTMYIQTYDIHHPEVLRCRDATQGPDSICNKAVRTLSDLNCTCSASTAAASRQTLVICAPDCSPRTHTPSIYIWAILVITFAPFAPCMPAGHVLSKPPSHALIPNSHTPLVPLRHIDFN